MRNCCFTINNYTTADKGRLEYLAKQPFCSYLIYAEEVGEKGTPHYQGYAEFTNDIKFKKLSREYFPRAHLEARRGTSKEASDYCKKEAQVYFEHGELTQQGMRSDIIGLRQAIQDGVPIDTIMSEWPELYLKYHSAIEKWISATAFRQGKEAAASEFDDYLWEPWQANILEMIKDKPHPRKINWIYDFKGGCGKSSLSRYLVSKENAFLITGGSKTDIFHAYQNQKIVVMDLARDFQGKEYIYDVLECFKNGQFLSTKYMSQVKMFAKPHVIVMANFKPETRKLSADRWNVITISDVLYESSSDSEAENLW